ncbi:MAG: DUF6446 family protein [Pseudomonadota bacterium]
MSGKLVGLMILLSAALVGAGVYYAQVYGYYQVVEDAEVRLTTFDDRVEPILIESFDAIDAGSSPIRYRACFTTPTSLPTFTETYLPFDTAEPLNAPGWFDCFDAGEIAAWLRSGKALAFVGEANIEYGIDRVVVITVDGRGYVWHQVNACGDKLYDGSPAADDCPARQER